MPFWHSSLAAAFWKVNPCNKISQSYLLVPCQAAWLCATLPWYLAFQFIIKTNLTLFWPTNWHYSYLKVFSNSSPGYYHPFCQHCQTQSIYSHQFNDTFNLSFSFSSAGTNSHCNTVHLPIHQVYIQQWLSLVHKCDDASSKSAGSHILWSTWFEWVASQRGCSSSSLLWPTNILMVEIWNANLTLCTAVC